MNKKFLFNEKFDKYFLYVIYVFIAFSVVHYLFPVTNYSFYGMKEIVNSSSYLPNIDTTNIKNSDDFSKAVEKSSLTSYQKKIYLDFAFLSECFDKNKKQSFEECKIKTDKKMNDMIKLDGANKLFYAIVLLSFTILSLFFVRKILRKNFKVLFTAVFVLIVISLVSLFTNLFYSSFIYLKPNMFGYEIFGKVYHSSNLGIDMCKINYGKISDCEMKAVRVSNDFVRREIMANGIKDNVYGILISFVLLLISFYFKKIDDKKFESYKDKKKNKVIVVKNKK